MSQALHFWLGDTPVTRTMPDPGVEIIDGVFWGEPWALFTPAYWVSQIWMSEDDAARVDVRSRATLTEELVFCLLGGYGITAELATAAFGACQDAGLVQARETCARKWAEILEQPLRVQGRDRRYRYPQQKAKFLAAAMVFLRECPLEITQGRSLRDALLRIKGVGPKTAGWVARNYLDADDVAILDVHLVRAGVICGLFAPAQRVERDYWEMERRFLAFCRALDVRPSVLDRVIWDQMRCCGRLAIEALRIKLTSVELGGGMGDMLAGPA